MDGRTRYIGLDLGGTNIKWAVVERSGPDGWHTLDRGQVPTDDSRGRSERGAPAGGPGHRGSRRRQRRTGASACGVAVPGLYVPETGVVTFLTNVPGDWSATPTGAPVASGHGPAHRAHQRRPRLRARRAALRRRARRGVVHRPHAGHRRRRRASPSATRSSRATADRPASWGTRPSTPTGPGAAAATAAAWRPTAAPTRWPSSAAPATRARPSRRPAPATSAPSRGWPRSGATWASASATPSPSSRRTWSSSAVAGPAPATCSSSPSRPRCAAACITTPVERVEVVLAELGTWAGAIGAAVHGAEQAARDGRIEALA